MRDNRRKEAEENIVVGGETELYGRHIRKKTKIQLEMEGALEVEVEG